MFYWLYAHEHRQWAVLVLALSLARAQYAFLGGPEFESRTTAFNQD